MFIVPFIFAFIISTLFEYMKGHNYWRSTVTSVTVLLLTGFIISIDYNIRTADTEVWSGTVIDWDHQEEWDEWIPPSETCTVNDKGIRTCTTNPGYWEHHNAYNKIKTSDGGWIHVYKSPHDNRKFSDKWPNTREELIEMWPPGTPSASVHLYRNKIQASYSLYRIEGIDENNYPDLPDYPDIVTNYINIDRIVGYVPNKEQAIKRLNEVNSYLNKFIDDPENPEKKRSWKQVNLIFVNVGPNKGEDYGFALQNYWKNGNKNDFIVSFSMNEDGKLNWVYVFSWSEVEILKLEVRDKMMEIGTITDFVPIIDMVSELVAEKFERKQFADFNYLKVEPTTGAYIIIWILTIISLVCQYIHYRRKLLEEIERQRWMKKFGYWRF